MRGMGVMSLRIGSWGCEGGGWAGMGIAGRGLGWLGGRGRWLCFGHEI